MAAIGTGPHADPLNLARIGDMQRLDSVTPPNLFTAGHVARFCQVDLKTIHNWCYQGSIRHDRTKGRHLRFRRLDVLDFLRKFGYPTLPLTGSGRPRLAVIDADPNVLRSLPQAIPNRHEMFSCADSIDALLVMGRLQPDVLIIDIGLPGIDGLHLVKSLKGIAGTAHVRTIVYSDQPEHKASAIAAGAHGLVSKGETKELREVLARLTGLDRS